MKMVTINAITPDRQEYKIACAESEIAKNVKMMQQSGMLNIKVTNQ